jgi:predicted  nucleic acid-binding Zn-ribbon protein
VSYDERPEFRALEELQEVLRHVTEELAAWRRRAQRAEGALGAGHDALAQRERVMELEGANRDLAERVEAARSQVEDLVKRLQFLEEQMAVEEPSR